MYEDLANLLDWESRIHSIAIEFGQRTNDRIPIAIYGPRFLTHLFSPQPRLLEDELRNFGTHHSADFPETWQQNWPGRDHERLYFILEEYGMRHQNLHTETERERIGHGIFSWSAGPIEVDIIVPSPANIPHLDPRATEMPNLQKTLIGRIGPTLQAQSIRNLSLPDAIKLSQDALRLVRAKVAPTADVPKEETADLDRPVPQPKIAPRKDSWIKA